MRDGAPFSFAGLWERWKKGPEPIDHHRRAQLAGRRPPRPDAHRPRSCGLRQLAEGRRPGGPAEDVAALPSAADDSVPGQQQGEQREERHTGRDRAASPRGAGRKPILMREVPVPALNCLAQSIPVDATSVSNQKQRDTAVQAQGNHPPRMA